jgi:beta-glucosidase
MSQRTYRYSQAEPLYPFGFGLSYTEFVYSDLVLEQVKVKVGEGVNGRFSLTNCGTVAAEEVAQIYLTDVAASVLVPQHKLVTFERVQLAADARRTISFTITPEMMMLIDDEGQAVLEPGQFKLTLGGCSPSTRGLALGASEPVGTTFAVV